MQARTLRRAASGARRNPRLSAANRLTQIRQAAGATNGNVQQTIGYTYDAADRLSRTTLANGITIDAMYDTASQLTSLTYKRPDGTLLGDLTYAYDAAGRRTRQGGSLATATNPVLGKLPPGVDITSASYDANHRLTNWNGQAYSYDANGNLTNDGARSYTWNARNQLQSIAPVNASGVPASSFAYDPLGRRAGKTIGAKTTGFLYDGANFVQELSEANTAQAGTDGTQASLIANLLTAGIDQTLLRQRLAATGTSITSSTPEHLLTDANNNTLGITNAATTPGFTTRYDYDAYGNVTQSTISGTPSDNSQQYTGRENDSTGLMYYRARYYLPNCARFISEDPIGWASGQVNNYAFVGGDPVSLIDPDGLRGIPGSPGSPSLPRIPPTYPPGGQLPLPGIAPNYGPQPAPAWRPPAPSAGNTDRQQLIDNAAEVIGNLSGGANAIRHPSIQDAAPGFRYPPSPNDGRCVFICKPPIPGTCGRDDGCKLVCGPTVGPR